MLMKRNIKLNNILIMVFLSIYAFVSAYPLIWMAFYSFKNNTEIFVTNPFGPPTAFRIENYKKALTAFPIPTYIMNSIIVVVASITITMVIAFMFSYATARMKWKLSNAAKFYISLGMFIPMQVILIPMTILVRDLNLLNSHWSLIVPYSAFNLAFTCVILHGFLRSIPYEMEESAFLDGANLFTVITKIIVPLVMPAVVSAVIFMFLAVWNEFLLAFILVSKETMKTLPLGLLSFQGRFVVDWGVMGAALTIAAIPSLIVYLIFSESFEKAISVGSAVKG